MSEISAQLRQFSRKSGETLTAVSPEACFDYALRLFQARLREAGVEVIRRWPEEPCWVRAGLVRLEQVLVHLIGNALQAIAATAGPRLQLSIAVQPDRLVTSAPFHAPVLPDAHLCQTIDPFFTT